jgi:hypothetical protein
MRAELPRLEPVAKSGDPIHLYGNRRGQETLVFNMFKVGVEIRGQWPHTKPGQKIRINERLHPPGWSAQGAELCRIASCRLPVCSVAAQHIRHSPGFGIAA